jgi:hypothetical protein
MISFGTVSAMLGEDGRLIGIEGYLPTSGITRDAIGAVPLVAGGAVRVTGADLSPGVAVDVPGTDFETRAVFDGASGVFALGNLSDATVAWEFAADCWIAVGLSGQPVGLVFKCPGLEQALS